MNPVAPRLLLATEDSEFDAAAESLALALARRNGQALQAVLPIVTNAEFEAIAPDVALRGEHEAAKRIAGIRARAHRAGVAMDIEVRRDEEAWRAIVTATVDLKTGWLIVRRRGRRGLIANLLVGEMVNRAAANASCAVLFVPKEARLWQRGVIAVIEAAANGTISSAASAVTTTAAAEAARSGLPLHLVGAVQDAAADRIAGMRQALDALAQQCGLDGRGVSRTVGSVQADGTISTGADSVRADLIVIGRGTTDSGTLAAPVLAVIGKANCAVLVVPR